MAEDVKHRMQLQNKLAGVCVDMCKEVGAFPKCTCPDFVAPDSTPGVMTWPELLEHMDNLSEWGHGQLKEWGQHASAIQIHAQDTACLTSDIKNRMQLQNKLAGVCVDMCKEVGAFPKCTCPDFVAPDSTPGVMTWPELLEHMDNLSEWGHGELKSWKSTASFVQVASKANKAPEDELAKEMTHDLEMNFNKIAPFGKEDTAKELQDHAAKTQDTLVDAVENAEVAEIKRAVFRALTRLRAATIKEFDTIARLETQAIDAYNDAHHYRAENPLAHLHEDEAPVETDKLKSFH